MGKQKELVERQGRALDHLLKHQRSEMHAAFAGLRFEVDSGAASPSTLPLEAMRTGSVFSEPIRTESLRSGSMDLPDSPSCLSHRYHGSLLKHSDTKEVRFSHEEESSPRMAGKLVISASSSVILESCDGSTEEAEPRSKAKARNTFVSEGAEMSRVSVHARALRLRSAYEDAARKAHDRRSVTLFDKMSYMANTRFRSFHEVSSSFRLCDLSRFEAVVQGNPYKICVAVAICLNNLFIGFTSDMAMSRALESYEQQSQGSYAEIFGPTWVTTVDFIFNFIFIAELAFRIILLQGGFCERPDWKWNLFDSIIVGASVLEMTLENIFFNASFMRILRIFRVARAMRMLRLMRFTHLVRKLRVMTLAIVNCSMMLMWAVLILVLVTFLFSIIFLNATSQYVSDALPEDVNIDGIREFFGSLSMTMLTLFMAVAGGIDWWEPARLLLEISPGYVVIFVLFVVITVLAVLNVINAIFVNDAMESTRVDHDLRMQGELLETSFMMDRLTQLYKTMENFCESDGVILDTDFVDCVEQDEFKIQLGLMGVHYTDGMNFFRLLDVNGDRWLGIDEFVMGCLRLKAGALLIDSTVLIQDTKQLLKVRSLEQKHALQDLKGKLQGISDKLEKMEERTRVRSLSFASSDYSSEATPKSHIRSPVASPVTSQLLGRAVSNGDPATDFL